MTDDAPRLNRRQRAKIETRAKVLAAAKEQFADGGYEAATIRTIVNAVGMSTGALFANFKDKETLYREIYGVPPVNNEEGRRAMILLRALLTPRADNADAIDILAGIDLVRDEALSLMRSVGWPYTKAAIDPDEMTYVDCVRLVLETPDVPNA